MFVYVPEYIDPRSPEPTHNLLHAPSEANLYWHTPHRFRAPPESVNLGQLPRGSKATNNESLAQTALKFPIFRNSESLLYIGTWTPRAGAMVLNRW